MRRAVVAARPRRPSPLRFPSSWCSRQRCPNRSSFPAKSCRSAGSRCARAWTASSRSDRSPKGRSCEAGQVLYRLDQVRYEAAYQGALARFENARSTLARLEPLLARARGRAAGRGQRARRSSTRRRRRVDAGEEGPRRHGRPGGDRRPRGTHAVRGRRARHRLRTTCSRRSTGSIRCTSPSGRRRSSCWRGTRIPARWALIQAGSRLAVQVVLPGRLAAAADRPARLRRALARRGDRHAGVPRPFDERGPAADAGPVRAGAARGLRARQTRSRCRSARCSRPWAASSCTWWGGRHGGRPRRAAGAVERAALDHRRGLNPGDRVIVDGTQKVVPGAGQAVPPGAPPPESAHWPDGALDRRPNARNPVLLHPAAGPGRGDLDHHHAARPVRHPAAARLALPADHAARRAGRRPSIPGATAQDVAEAVAAPIEQQLVGLAGDALLLVGQRQRRHDEPVRSTSTSPATRTSRRWTCRTRCSSPQPQLPAAVAPERDHHPQGEHRHPRRGRAHLERSALRRGVPHQLHEAVRRGRAEARAGHRQRHDLRRPRSSRCCCSSTRTRWRSSGSR